MLLTLRSRKGQRASQRVAEFHSLLKPAVPENDSSGHPSFRRLKAVTVERLLHHNMFGIFKSWVQRGKKRRCTVYKVGLQLFAVAVIIPTWPAIPRCAITQSFELENFVRSTLALLPTLILTFPLRFATAERNAFR